MAQTMIFGFKKVAIEVGVKKDEVVGVAKFSKCFKPELLEDFNFYDPCYFEFHNTKSIDVVIKALEECKYAMIQKALDNWSMEDER